MAMTLPSKTNNFIKSFLLLIPLLLIPLLLQWSSLCKPKTKVLEESFYSLLLGYSVNGKIEIDHNNNIFLV